MLCSAYRIYMEIVRKRLEIDIEKKRIIPESQNEFRSRRSTSDNNFVLDHITQKEKGKGKKDRKVYALFIDVKAAFDNVNREKL